MKRGPLLLLAALAVGLLGVRATAAPTIYTGSLTSPSGIDGREGWIDPGPTSIEWEVTVYDTVVHYKYTLTVPESENEISHFLIEVSDNFTTADFSNATGPFNSTEINDFGTGNGNPDIPDTVHGLKFDETSGTTAVFEFDSLRLPVWGDWYGKCGGNPPNQAWNLGLTASDTDPGNPPSSGSVDNHILVPDSVIVPEPATFALLAVGLAAMVRRRRRQ